MYILGKINAIVKTNLISSSIVNAMVETLSAKYDVTPLQGHLSINFRKDPDWDAIRNLYTEVGDIHPAAKNETRLRVQYSFGLSEQERKSGQVVKKPV